MIVCRFYDILITQNAREKKMKPNNICKFPPSSFSNDLSVFCFVLETDKTVMEKEHTLSHNRMILIEQGDGEFSFNNVSCAFSAGTLIFGFEGEHLSLLKGENIRYLYIDFGGSRASNLFHRFEIIPSARKFEGFNGLIPFFKDCLLATKQENIDIIGESVLLHAFSRLTASDAKQNATIQKIIEITERNFQDPNLSLTAIAQKIGYSPKYLSHFFKEKMNTTYVEYLRSYRFQYAISLFELGISSVKNAALLSGFCDPLYFSNSFKKAIGVSPTEFIKNREQQSSIAK